MEARKAGLALILALALAPVAAAAPQQPPPPSPQQKDKPKPKAKKVWDQDELKDLKKPSDVYVEKKQAEEDAAAAARADADKPKPESGTEKPAADAPAAFKGEKNQKGLPKTIEDCDKAIDEKSAEIDGQEQILADLRRELTATSEDAARADLGKKIEAESKTLDVAKEELDYLRILLQALKAKAAAVEKPPAPATPPPGA